MGSPLAPVLANIFMGYCETKWLNEYNLNKPKFYLRFADTFDKEQDSLNFLNFLNKKNPKSKLQQARRHYNIKDNFGPDLGLVRP